MAKYGKKASQKVERAMRERKRGTLRSGGSGKKVTSRNRLSRSVSARRAAPAARFAEKRGRKKSKK